MIWPRCHGMPYQCSLNPCRPTPMVFFSLSVLNWMLSLDDYWNCYPRSNSKYKHFSADLKKLNRYFHEKIIFCTTGTNLVNSPKEMQKLNRWSLILARSILLFLRSLTVYFCSVYSPAKHFHTKINSYAVRQGEYCSPLLL